MSSLVDIYRAMNWLESEPSAESDEPTRVPEAGLGAAGQRSRSQDAIRGAHACNVAARQLFKEFGSSTATLSYREAYQ